MGSPEYKRLRRNQKIIGFRKKSIQKCFEKLFRKTVLCICRPGRDLSIPHLCATLRGPEPRCASKKLSLEVKNIEISIKKPTFPRASPSVSASFPELKMRFLDSSRNVDTPRTKKLLLTPSSFDFRSISLKLPGAKISWISQDPNCTVSRP